MRPLRRVARGGAGLTDSPAGDGKGVGGEGVDPPVTPSPPAPPKKAPATLSIPPQMLGAAVLAGALLGIYLGIRLGRGLALQHPVPTEVLRVQRCEDCEARKAAEAVAATSPADVAAMVARQQEVERAAVNGD